jgi:hypothetical protein
MRAENENQWCGSGWFRHFRSTVELDLNLKTMIRILSSGLEIRDREYLEE